MRRSELYDFLLEMLWFFFLFWQIGFKRQAVNIMKEVLILDCEIQSGRGWLVFSGGEQSAKVSNWEHSHASAASVQGFGARELPLSYKDGAAIMATQTEGSLMNFTQMLSGPGLDSSGSRGEIGSSWGSLPVPKSLGLMYSGQTNLTLSWPLPPRESLFPCFSATPTH